METNRILIAVKKILGFGNPKPSIFSFYSRWRFRIIRKRKYKERSIYILNKLANISITGRVAFAICCLTILIRNFKLEQLGWKLVLEEFWSYTTIQYLDEWSTKAVEYTPSSILEFEDYIESNYTYVNSEIFYQLKNLYSNVHPDIREVIDLIFDVGTADLYGKVEKKGQSFKYLTQIIDIMNKHEVNLPDIDQFEKFEFNKNAGWGDSIDRGEIIH